MNKEERKTYMAEWHKNTWPTRKAKRAEQSRIRRQELVEWMREVKSSIGCRQCDEDHPLALDFHHTRDKEHNVADMCKAGYGKETIQEEMNKCIVLCANCHRKFGV